MSLYSAFLLKNSVIGSRKLKSERGLDDCSDYVQGATKDPKTTPEERSLLLDLLSSVNQLRQLMVGDTRPSNAAVKATVDIIKQLWGKWTPMLKNHSSTLARWDCLHGTVMPRSLDVYVNEIHQIFLSSSTLSSKSCFVSIEEFIALQAIASATYLAQFLSEGYFVVKAIDAEQRDVHVDLSLVAISGSFLQLGRLLREE